MAKRTKLLLLLGLGIITLSIPLLTNTIATAQQKDSTKSTSAVQADTWISVACGRQHTIAIKKDGTLWAWGDNEYGQLGLNDNNARTRPVQVGTANDWKTVWANNYSSVALKKNGNLWRWGAHNLRVEQNMTAKTSTKKGQIITTPEQVGSDSDWTDVFCGLAEVIAIKKDGSLWGWGNEILFGGGGSGWWDKPNPIKIKTILPTKSVVFGRLCVIALKSDGTLWSWGALGTCNDYGQLGQGTIDGPKVVDHKKPVQIGTDKDWKMTSSDECYLVALKTDGTLWAWGKFSHYEGKPTRADKEDCKLSPAQVGTDKDWSQVIVSGSNTLGIKTNGTLWRWVYYGQAIVDGKKVESKPPSFQQVGTDTDWKYIIHGLGYYATLKNDGTLWTWGGNEFGQLGLGDYKIRDIPTLITR